SRSLGSLTSLEANHLALVADALAFVRLGWTNFANTSGGFTHQLFVMPTDQDQAAFASGVGDASRRLHFHGVGVAHVQDQVLAFDLCTVAHALHHQCFGEAFAGAYDHVADHSAGGAVHAAAKLVFAGALDMQAIAFLLEADRPGEGM